MQSLQELLQYLRDPTALISAVGTLGITAVIFIETGLVFPFLPGDSLLVSAGLLASQPNGLVQLNVWQLGAYCTVAAIAGNLVGYAIGRRGGAALFRREDSRFFKRSHLVQAHQFYERHGGKTIVIARFMPIIRTFVPVVAGAAEMNFGAFAVYSIAGGTAWIWSMLLIGYFIATRMPVVGQHIEGLIVGIVFVSVLPAAIAWWRSRKRMSAP